ncbi:MAG: DUF6678 family protein [Gammaproteobacteria bacterium]
MFRTPDNMTKILTDRQLTSYANRTRWARFFESVKRLELLTRVKWLLGNEAHGWGRWKIPTDGYFEHFGLGPIPFREIEWVEIRSGKSVYRGRLVDSEELNFSAEITSALEKSKLDYSSEEGLFRIWGYR